ncbi:c-type cytochrome [Roseospira navarrensis]|uniref:C-type cytochrome n=1 Tax=Roseospira navarrensis TaxID=140058 RepID=A0A7X1ZFX5_9PROT|nr:c-type cytochrome [Roseospira navarrensis]MQX37796.1 c-type cytochrome [Roseospira navarrensis]
MQTRVFPLVLAAALAVASPAVWTPAGAADGDRRPTPDLIAQNCATCHGMDGRVFTEAMPALAGMDPEDFVAAMRAFRDDRRPGTIMDRIAKAFTEDDVAALAAHYAALPADPLPQEAHR